MGERNFSTLFDRSFSSVDETIDAIADRYMTINCACFTPNNERLGDIKSMIEKLHAHGLIHYALQFCTPYMVEAYRVRQAINGGRFPFLGIETDYSMEDMGQLKTRIEAFVEMIKEGPHS
ncbi:MAG: (R)-2-hydroxyglutaryl-CoA dehydratase subunit beta [Syntrophorhabdus sp. PtaU1.Bin002]|nr:MAG: (R)-2-hydroxyglutaryl-CoA dehydratase subunit beta [Syntrophorhabdus sp. PtaU1.Bin002]